MNRTDLDRARAQTMAKRPAEVIRAEPITLTAVRAVPRAPARQAPARTFAQWRREHYVADQLTRVAAILTAGLALLAFLAALAVWAIRWIAGELSGPLAGGAGLIGLAALMLAVVLIVKATPGRADHDSYGFHWTKCKK